MRPSMIKFPHRLDGKNLTLSEFYYYMRMNEPVIVSNAVNDWKARRCWVTDVGAPDWELLKNVYGNIQVPVTKDGGCLQEKLSFNVFLDNLSANRSYQFYLKDWHFCNDSTEEWYNIPDFLQLDWVNNVKEVTENNIFRGDYRFCYIGGAGTWTGFHSDVMNSYSWSANICGCKEWIMVPKDVKMVGKKRLEDIEDIRTEDWKSAGGFHFAQVTGEIVFVPSGWYHQVENMEVTISINHNWINHFNIKSVIDLMLERLKEVKKEVRLMGTDVQDPISTAEVLLRDDYGLNITFSLKLLEIMLDSARSGDLFADKDVDILQEHTNICRCLLNVLIKEQNDLLQLSWLKE